MKTLKSHPRQWVDCSGPAYKQYLLTELNPTNGSWWIVQVRPITEQAQVVSLIDNKVRQSIVEVDAKEVGLEQSTNFRWWDFDTHNALFVGWI